MRNRSSVGAGSLLPSAANVNDKKQKSSGTPARTGTPTTPTPPPRPPGPHPGATRVPPPLPPVPPSGTLVTLGEQGHRAMEQLCRCYQVKPEHVMRAIVEGFLVDACSDDTLAPGMADEARDIERSGSVPPSWWDGKDRIVLPGFDSHREEVGTPAASSPAAALASPGEAAHRAAREVVAGMRAYFVPGAFEWPRTFDVPGVGFHREMSAEEAVSHVCSVLHNCEAELHAMTADHLATRPAQMAELAEVLAMAEEVVCSDGGKTDLDETPAGELSGLGRFAATAKALAILKPPTAGKPKHR